MAVTKNNATQAKQTPAPRKPKSASPAKKKQVSSSSGSRAKTAPKPVSKRPAKKAAPRAAKASPKQPAGKAPSPPAQERETRVAHAAKKVIDDLAANRNVVRTKKATKEMAHQLLDRAENIVKDAASASSETVGKARKATRRTAYNFVKSAIKFLESVEGKIEDKPSRKKAAGKKPAGKNAAAGKPGQKAKKTSPAAVSKKN